MKFVRLAALVACTFLLSTLAFGKDKNQGKMDLMEAAQVGSTQLPPGHYKLEWQPEQGQSVKLEVLQKGKTVATAEARLKDLPTPSLYDAVTTKPTRQNKKKVEEIDFSNRREAIVLGS